jgi:hypothetical protein
MNNQESPVSSAFVVLSEVMGLYGRDMTSLETELWPKMIKEFGDEAIIRFLAKHVEKSVFAPKPAEVMQALRPSQDNSSSAFEELYRKVVKVGPYGSPVFEDPAIAGVIVLLGGWVKVNEQMPDPTASRFDYEAYAKRFDVLYKQSNANLMLGKGHLQPILGMHDPRLRLQAPSSLALAIEAKPEDLTEVQGVDYTDEPRKKNHFSALSDRAVS